MNSLVVATIATAVAGSTAILIAATGELLVEKTGVYNIGLEGMMLFGALVAFIVSNDADSWIIGLLIAACAGAACAAVLGLVAVILRADMIVAGIALYLAALGATGQLGRTHANAPATSMIPEWHVPLLSDVPYVGPAIFEQRVLVYIALLLPFLAQVVLRNTRHGLQLRAIGEDPRTADEAGIPVVAWRFVYLVIGGALAGVAGGFVTLGLVGTWSYNVTAGQGWIAFAIVMFAGWRPLWLLIGAYLFGALAALGNLGQAEGWEVPVQVFNALPYIGTVAIVMLRAYAARKRQATGGWPAALGQPFYRAG